MSDRQPSTIKGKNSQIGGDILGLFFLIIVAGIGTVLAKELGVLFIIPAVSILGSTWILKKLYPNRDQVYRWIVALQIPIIIAALFALSLQVVYFWGPLLSITILTWFLVTPSAISASSSILYSAFTLCDAILIGSQSFGMMPNAGKIGFIITFFLRLLSTILLLYYLFASYKKKWRAYAKDMLPSLEGIKNIFSSGVIFFIFNIFLVMSVTDDPFWDVNIGSKHFLFSLALYIFSTIYLFIIKKLLKIRHEGFKRIGYLLFGLGMVIGAIVYINVENHISGKDYALLVWSSILGGLGLLCIYSIAYHATHWVKRGFRKTSNHS